MRITINPGHCQGQDPGAVGQTGLQEAIVAYDIGLRLQQLLKADYSTDFIVANDLQEICDIANAGGADLFISIHCNAAENRAARGTETYCNVSSTEGRHLAEFINAEMVGLGLVDRGVKEKGFYVLRYTNMPAVLVETAFISNTDDEAMLASEAGRQQIAEAIYRGIKKYTEGM